MEHLKGLQALLVRPIQPDGHGDEMLSAKLIAEGALLHHFPVMKITPLGSSLNQDLISHYILNLFLYDRAIFVSRAATFFVVDWLKHNSDLMPQVLPVGPRYYAVGKTTATELKKYNVDALNIMGWLLCRHESDEAQQHELWHLANPTLQPKANRV